MVAEFSQTAVMVCATLAVYGSTVEARDGSVSSSPDGLAVRFLGAFRQSLADSAVFEERSGLHHSARCPPNSRLCLGSSAPGKSDPATAFARLSACPGVLGILRVRLSDHQPFRRRRGLASFVP